MNQGVFFVRLKDLGSTNDCYNIYDCTIKIQYEIVVDMNNCIEVKLSYPEAIVLEFSEIQRIKEQILEDYFRKNFDEYVRFDCPR